jgi:hypothetical protein
MRMERLLYWSSITESHYSEHWIYVPSKIEGRHFGILAFHPNLVELGTIFFLEINLKETQLRR